MNVLQENMHRVLGMLVKYDSNNFTPKSIGGKGKKSGNRRISGMGAIRRIFSCKLAAFREPVA